MFRSLVLAVGTYYLSAVLQTLFHRWFGHHNRIQKIYTTHAEGHHAVYPPQRLLSEAWESSDRHVLWYYALPFTPLAAGVAWAWGAVALLVHLGALAFSVWWHLYLHEHYHIKGTWWERFAWFRRKRRLHLIHHCEEHSNYAIVEFWIDRLLRTRRE